MKKLFLILAMVLMLAGAVQAQDFVISSGMTTSDRLIATGKCSYYGMMIVSGASTAVVSIYDALTASGTTVATGNCPIASGQCFVGLPFGVAVFTGIYADTTGTGAAYTVFYRCR